MKTTKFIRDFFNINVIFSFEQLVRDEQTILFFKKVINLNININYKYFFIHIIEFYLIF